MEESLNAPLPLFNRRSSVVAGQEFKRIRDLPRRSWDSTLAERLTALLKTNEGKQELRPLQAQALYEIGTYGGLFGPIRVGAGKTLISLLAPRVRNAKRPLLLLPAALKEKTERERNLLAKDWRVSSHLRIMSYEMLSRIKSCKDLEIYKPDLIIADECHKLKNKQAGVTKRVNRYMLANPATEFVAMSGTVMKSSLKDFAHLVAWTHKAGAPVPLTPENVEEWSSALDEKINPFQRKHPGALLQFASGTGTELERARRGFNDRFVSTPGIVASQPVQDYEGSLIISGLEYSVNDATEQNFKTLRELWETPDGWTLSEAVEVWRHARELSLGLHYVWEPRPPDEWLDARRDWASFVRDFLSRSRSLDTELQVTNAVLAGNVKDGGLLASWSTVKPTFIVNPKPIWHDDSALKICENWLKHNDGICWVEHTFFAAELARRTRLPYFGAGGLDKSGKPIEAATGPVIASIAANGTGRNLQRWSSNLLTTVPGGQTLEQLIGRTHRFGQQADEVTVEVLIGCSEHIDAMNRAISGARCQQDMIGQTQKLLLADLTYPSSIGNHIGFRWNSNQTKKK